MMRIDVSEVKAFRECKRKHQFSSRNRFHLRPIKPNDNLVFGTQFHEVLAMMYMGTDLDKILEWVNREVVDSVYWKVMDMMVKGYYNGPYQEDKKRYVVLDVEKSFCYPIGLRDHTAEEHANIKYAKDLEGQWYGYDEDGVMYEAICACGSIDMICIDSQTGSLVGFEHKTAKNFRPDIYDLVDEQPRLYFWALKQILEDYHAQGKYLEVTESGPIYLNQVRKLQTKFDYHRSVCKYSDEDLNRFMKGFVRSAQLISDGTDILPEPGFMKCQMCDYADLCMHYGYCDINRDELVKEFEGEYEIREFDHLEEKASRHNEEAD